MLQATFTLLHANTHTSRYMHSLIFHVMEI